jgi:hypothetical protein
LLRSHTEIVSGVDGGVGDGNALLAPFGKGGAMASVDLLRRGDDQFLGVFRNGDRQITVEIGGQDLSRRAGWSLWCELTR